MHSRARPVQAWRTNLFACGGTGAHRPAVWPSVNMEGELGFAGPVLSVHLRPHPVTPAVRRSWGPATPSPRLSLDRTLPLRVQWSMVLAQQTRARCGPCGQSCKDASLAGHGMARLWAKLQQREPEMPGA